MYKILRLKIWISDKNVNKNFQIEEMTKMSHERP